MVTLTTVILLSAVLLILHTYLFYPLGMILLFGRQRPACVAGPGSELPEIAILIAAYNEEKVIGKKLNSVFNSSYPPGKIQVYVGSDASDDGTDGVVQGLQAEFANLHLVRFSGRIGKIGIINELAALAKTPVLVLTDANVFLEHDTLLQLIHPLLNPQTGLTAANIRKVSDNDNGIALQEKKYLSLENKIKTAESNAFRLIMGAEGGCYAVRRELFSRVPDKFIVDDFFVTFGVIGQGRDALFVPQAHCTEDTPSGSRGEYRRKVRISTGNFQNLFYFKRHLLPFWTPLGFCFWSHKVLRWFTPVLLLVAFCCTTLLLLHSKMYLLLFLLQAIGFLSPAITALLQINIRFLKFVSHFYLMNYALLEGFIKFVSGVKSNIWQPVQRNV